MATELSQIFLAIRGILYPLASLKRIHYLHRSITLYVGQILRVQRARPAARRRLHDQLAISPKPSIRGQSRLCGTCADENRGTQNRPGLGPGTYKGRASSYFFNPGVSPDALSCDEPPLPLAAEFLDEPDESAWVSIEG